MAVVGMFEDYKCKEVTYNNKDIYLLEDIKHQIIKQYSEIGITFKEDMQIMFNSGIDFAIKQIDYKIMYLKRSEMMENK